MTIQFRKINQILFWAGTVLLVSELWKQLVINLVLQPAGSGAYAVWYFPFQLCSTPMYVCLLLMPAVRAGKERLVYALDTYLTTYGMLGGIFAFFDTSGFTELGYLPISVHSYLWHILLIGIGMLASYALIAQQRSDFFGATALFLGNCLVAQLLNKGLGQFGTINMFYINPKYKMAQKYFGDIALYLGNNPGILVYVLTILLGATTIYIALLCLSCFLRRSGQDS